MSAAIVHGGGVARVAAQYGGRPSDWLDLSTGINPCPPALPAIEARAWHRLPDMELEEAARNAARAFYGSGDRLPLAVPGTQAAIQLLPRLVAPGRRIAILSPTYGEYQRAFEMAGMAVDQIASVDKVDARHALVVVVNPNNPDGRCLSAQALQTLAAGLQERGAVLVVDEAFGDVDPGASVAGLDLENLIVFRSFGKFFGMAGVRLGFVIASDAMTTHFSSWLGPWAVSGPALSVAVQLFRQDPRHLRAEILRRRAALDQCLVGGGLRIAGGCGLFALVEDSRATALHEHLCRSHILTRRFDYAPSWLRFGLAPDTDGDARLVDALSTWKQERCS